MENIFNIYKYWSILIQNVKYFNISTFFSDLEVTLANRPTTSRIYFYPTVLLVTPIPFVMAT